MYFYIQDLSEDGIIDEVKIKNLVDSLEAGVDVFDDVEKEILMTMNRSIPKSKPPKSQPEATTATAAAATASESKKPKHK